MYMRRLLETGIILFIAGLLILTFACRPKTDVPSSTTSQNTAMKLAFITQPDGNVAGSDFKTQPSVAVEDAQGNIVTSFKGAIVLSITPGSGSGNVMLQGGTTLVAANGKADFKYLSVNKAGVGYTLTALSGNLTPATSTPFTVSPGTPAKLAFSVEPTGGKAGEPLTPAPEVIVQDTYGNTVTGFEGSVTVSATITYPNFYATPENGQPKFQIVPISLSGTTIVKMVNGVARLTDISSTMAGRVYNLKAVCESLDSATSAYFEILSGEPVKLIFTQEPIGSAAGTPFENQPSVVLEDIYGNVVTTSKNSTVAISITPGSGTPGAILSGTITVKTDSGFGGLAEFWDLSIDSAGTGYTLTADTSGVPPAISLPFDISEPERGEQGS
jgi:hypothetical protein